jgi:tRNA nucleotidyltransferase/poly(A) polymerase
MTLKELLRIIEDTSAEIGIRKPYIVGGIPRDIAMSRIEALNDIDLTNGESSIGVLADAISVKLGIPVRVLPDGHKKLRYEKFSIDFSTNQIYSNIDALLEQRGIENPNDMVRETFSRDFTINTLLVPLDFSKLIDITAMARHDLKYGIIRCPVDPTVAIINSPNRIIRAFYYAAKYNMRIDDDLKSAIKANLNLFVKIKEKYASDKLSAAIRLNSEIVNDLIDTGVLSKIKLTKPITDELMKLHRLADVL